MAGSVIGAVGKNTVQKACALSSSVLQKVAEVPSGPGAVSVGIKDLPVLASGCFANVLAVHTSFSSAFSSQFFQCAALVLCRSKVYLLRASLWSFLADSSR